MPNEEAESSSEEKEKETAKGKPEEEKINLAIEAIESTKEDTLTEDSVDADVATKAEGAITDDLPGEPLLPHCSATEQKSSDPEVIEAHL